MGNLYTKKSPAATNSSVAHEQKDVLRWAITHVQTLECNRAMFFKFALPENLEWVISDGMRQWIVDNGTHWAYVLAHANRLDWIGMYG